MRESVSLFLDSCVAAERCLLAAGWRDPEGLHEESLEADLASRDFVLDSHSAQFAYLCWCHELGCDPSISQILRCSDLRLDDLDQVMWIDYEPRLIREYVSAVKDCATRRSEAREHLQAAAMLVGEALGTIDLSAEAQVSFRGKHVVIISERDRLSLAEARKLSVAMRGRTIVVPRDWQPDAEEVAAMVNET